MNTIYFRKEPTIDELLTSNYWNFSKRELKALAKKKDVVMYQSMSDVRNGTSCGRWMWYYKSKPHKNKKTIVIGGMARKIVWLETLK